MKLYAVWCEWDVGLNIDGNTGCYSSEKNLYDKLGSVDWSEIEFGNTEQVIDAGLLTIEEIEG